MLAGRQRLVPIFFLCQHHIYRSLVLRDIIVRQQQPNPVKEYVCQTTSYSVTGDVTRGEGGDFLLKAKNRSAKSWIPPGLPSTS